MKSRLWVEAHRPKTVAEYVFVDQEQKKLVEHWIKDGSFPHLLLSGDPGTGKTTLAKVLINELGIEDFDVLEINASRENGIDMLREKINNFVQTMPFGKFKVALLDECLEENTKVVVLRDGQEQLIEIKNLDDTNDLVKSFNLEKNKIEWKPFVLFDKGIQDTIEIEFENGESVICTPDHKWYVDIEGVPTVVKAHELHKYSAILTA